MKLSRVKKYIPHLLIKYYQSKVKFTGSKPIENDEKVLDGLLTIGQPDIVTAVEPPQKIIELCNPLKVMSISLFFALAIQITRHLWMVLI